MYLKQRVCLSIVDTPIEIKLTKDNTELEPWTAGKSAYSSHVDRDKFYKGKHKDQTLNSECWLP